MSLPGGTFTMGSPSSEYGRNADEAPHGVAVAPFLIGEHEVTQREWRDAMGANPSHFADCGDDCPVEEVNFYDVADYLAKLTARSSDFSYRLPSEAEWEYACRAGTTTPFATGGNLTTDQANYNGTFPYAAFPRGRFRGRPARVRSFPPNAWGLFDMEGNVWEWTSDWYRHEGKRVIRGGSWYFDANSARCALRYTHAPKDRGFSLGFRVAANPKRPARR